MSSSKVASSGAEKKPSLSSLKPDTAKGRAARTRAIKRIASAASKKSRPSSAQKTVLKKVVAARGKKQKADDFSVSLPTTMSIRAREKALVILFHLSQDFHEPAQKIAFVSALCFVVLGAYLVIPAAGFVSSPQTLQGALVTDSQVIETTETTDHSSQDYPTFVLLETIPNEIANTARYSFTLSAVKNVSVTLTALETGSRFDVRFEELVPGTFRYIIEPDSLDPGRYVAKAYAEALTDGSKHTYVLGEFGVPGTEAKNTATTSSAEPLPAPVSETHATTEQDTGEKDQNSVSTTPPRVLPPDNAELTLTMPLTINNMAAITFKAQPEVAFIEVYLRSVASIQPRFLGLAEKRTEGWFYFFDTRNVPDGEYEFFGQTRLNEMFVRSNSSNTTVANTMQNISPFETEEQMTDEQGATSSESTAVMRTFTEFSPTAEPVENESIVGFVDDIFETERESLSTLLQRYAVAKQSEDSLLMTAVQNEIDMFTSDITDQLLSDSTAKYLADDITESFTARVRSWQRRIDTFEELRRTAGSENTNIDSDGDGISDYDEKALYNTDPTLPDTDNDGFTDGIEIVRGYDPRDPAAEVTVSYELPTDTIGLTVPELLVVESATPYIVNHDVVLEPLVQAEIRGRGLPNSFVTLYVFSMPIIVTVKTDVDGSFVYTFEKELEDGEHHVFAAITDNTGAIIAQSSPFSFVKRAQAFTPVGAEAETMANTETLAELKTFNLYNLSIGLGILSLGVILLLLGIGLRTKDEPTIVPGNDLRTT